MPREFYEQIDTIERLPHLSPVEVSSLQICTEGSLVSLADSLAPNLPMQIPNIEVTGMPKTGKTTLIESASHMLSQFGIQNEVVAERDVPDEYLAYEHGYNLAYALKAAEKLMELFSSDEKPNGVGIFDRGIYNPIPFAQAWGNDQSDILASFFDEYYGGFFTALIIINCTPEACIDRGGKLGNRFLTTLSSAFEGLPQQIARLRLTSGSVKDPLLIAEIDGNLHFSDYEEQFKRTIGTILQLASGIK